MLSSHFLIQKSYSWLCGAKALIPFRVALPSYLMHSRMPHICPLCYTLTEHAGCTFACSHVRILSTSQVFCHEVITEHRKQPLWRFRNENFHFGPNNSTSWQQGDRGRHYETWMYPCFGPQTVGEPFAVSTSKEDLEMKRKVRVQEHEKENVEHSPSASLTESKLWEIA